METLRDLDIVRAATSSVLLTRDDDDAPAMPTMVVRFSPFDTWYEINSWFEGRFLERTIKGAFRKTIREDAARTNPSERVKVLFNHGMDFNIGDKVLGIPTRIWEASDAATGEVQLLDNADVRNLLPGIEAGAYGSSFMFRVVKDEWNDEPGKSDHNPEGIPERTIKEVRLFEFGPVTFPANPAATAGVRSMTDEFYERMRDRDPHQVEELAKRALQLRTARSQPAAPMGTGEPPAAAQQDDDEPASSHSARSRFLQWQARERLAQSQKENVA